MRGAVEVGKDLFDFGAGEDGGEPFRPFGGCESGEGRQRPVEDFAVEEDKGAAGDVLRRSGDVSFNGEVCEVKTHVVGSQVLRVPFAVEGG